MQLKISSVVLLVVALHRRYHRAWTLRGWLCWHVHSWAVLWMSSVLSHNTWLLRFHLISIETLNSWSWRLVLILLIKRALKRWNWVLFYRVLWRWWEKSLWTLVQYMLTKLGIVEEFLVTHLALLHDFDTFKEFIEVETLRVVVSFIALQLA